MTPEPKSDGKCVKEKLSEQIIDCNVNVRLEIREGNDASSKAAVKDYQVIGIYTTEYNK